MMITMLRHALCRWAYATRGATAIEYSIIAGCISLAIVTAVLLLGDDLSGIFDSIAQRIGEAAGRVDEE